MENKGKFLKLDKNFDFQFFSYIFFMDTFFVSIYQ